MLIKNNNKFLLDNADNLKLLFFEAYCKVQSPVFTFNYLFKNKDLLVKHSSTH